MCFTCHLTCHLPLYLPLYLPPALQNTAGAAAAPSESDRVGNLKGGFVKGQWTREEDELVCKYVELYGTKQWARIALVLPVLKKKYKNGIGACIHALAVGGLCIACREYCPRPAGVCVCVCVCVVLVLPHYWASGPYFAPRQGLALSLLLDSVWLLLYSMTSPYFTQRLVPTPPLALRMYWLGNAFVKPVFGLLESERKGSESQTSVFRLIAL